MRILYLADSYRPARSACANRTVVLVEALRAAGHDVQVLASSDSLIGASQDYQQPEYVTFFKTYPLVEKTFVNRLRNNFGGVRSSVAVARRMGDFDVVVCTTPPLLLTSAAVKIARVKHAKLVLDVRDIWPDVAYEMGSFAPGSPYGRFFAYLAHRAYRASSLVVTVSPGKAEKLRGRVGQACVELVPNGIDEAFVAQTEDERAVADFGFGRGPVCVYVGNIGLAQGLGTLLDMAKARPSVRFLLFGEGADRSKLEERVRREGIANVVFCGTVSARGVYTVLKRASCSYIPLVSSRLKDSIPTKMYEALACGCPVLLAASGDACDLLDKAGLGQHAAPEDAAAQLAALDRLLEAGYSEEERRRAAAYIVGHHSRQRFAARFVDLIADVASKGPRA